LVDLYKEEIAEYAGTDEEAKVLGDWAATSKKTRGETNE
jgi:hypothetical protein